MEKKELLGFSTDRNFYRMLLDNLYDGVYMTDPDRKILYWNQGAERITGYSADEVVGQHCWDNILVHVDENGTALCTHLCPAKAAIIEGNLREAEIYLHHKNGHRVPIAVRVAPVRDDQGEIRGAVEIFSERFSRNTYLQRIEELEHLALLDPLTEFGNRRYAEVHLQSRLMETERYGSACGVMFLDIDHFKDVNDRYSHQMGDRVLKMVAMTLAGNVRQFDIVSRWGGEEFLVILANVDENTVRTLAEKLRNLVARSSIDHDAGILSVTVSIGATISRSDDTVESLIARADALMCMSKENGRDRVSLG